MRLLLLVMVVALGVDAYAYSGAYTQATVNEVSRGFHRLTSNISKESKQPTPLQPVPKRAAPTS
jgi:hypothetical protein